MCMLSLFCKPGVVPLAFTCLLVLNILPAVVAQDGYWNEGTAAEDNSNWMANLPGANPISHLSLPGTHDTGSYNYGRETTETQGMNVFEQLKAGIRVWDMRLGQNHLNVGVECMGPNLWTFHGIACQFEKFIDILSIAQSFLIDHPSETILMRVKEENCCKVDDFVSQVESEMDGFPDLFYKGGKRNPTLDEGRGKIVLYRDYGKGFPRWSSLDIQDEYSVSNNWGLTGKWNLVKEKFMESDDASTLDEIHVNFLSASGGSFPYFIASGQSSWETNAPALLTVWVTGPSCNNDNNCIDEFHRVGCLGSLCSIAFEGINDLATNYIKDSIQLRTGIVMADFPGPGLIRAIIDTNSKLPPIMDTTPPPTGLPTAPPQLRVAVILSSTVNVNGMAMIVATIFDPEGGAERIDWDLGDGSPTLINAGLSIAHQYTQTGVFLATAHVTSENGEAALASSFVTVSNVAPVVTVTGTTIGEGSVTSVAVEISDDGAGNSNIRLDWGDGQQIESFSVLPGDQVLAFTHTYLDDGVYTVSIQVEDASGATGSDMATVNVNNVPPTASIESVIDTFGNTVGDNADLDIVLVRLDIDVLVGFADAGILDTHIAQVEWGDGTIATSSVMASPEMWTHAYAEAGDYLMQITITDDDSSSVTVSQLIQVMGPVDAVMDAANDLEQILIDMDSAEAARSIHAALAKLQGSRKRKASTQKSSASNKGKKEGGALQYLMDGKWSSGFDQLESAIEYLLQADPLVDEDLSVIMSQLLLVVKAVISDLYHQSKVQDLECASTLIADADAMGEAGKFLEAIETYQRVASALKERGGKGKGKSKALCKGKK